MIVNKKHFPPILSENEAVYFFRLENLIQELDEHSYLQITRVNKGYIFRISPSSSSRYDSILEKLFKYHNSLGIFLDVSKSIKNSGALTFKILWDGQ